MIDKEGNITSTGVIKTNVIEFNELKSSSNAAGHGVILTGNTFTDIASPLVSSDSKILLSPSSDTGGELLIVKTRTVGVGFRVTIQSASVSDITFDWLVVN